MKSLLPTFETDRLILKEVTYASKFSLFFTGLDFYLNGQIIDNRVYALKIHLIVSTLLKQQSNPYEYAGVS